MDISVLLSLTTMQFPDLVEAITYISLPPAIFLPVIQGYIGMSSLNHSPYDSYRCFTVMKVTLDHHPQPYWK